MSLDTILSLNTTWKLETICAKMIKRTIPPIRNIIASKSSFCMVETRFANLVSQHPNVLCLPYMYDKFFLYVFTVCSHLYQNYTYACANNILTYYNVYMCWPTYINHMHNNNLETLVYNQLSVYLCVYAILLWGSIRKEYRQRKGVYVCMTLIQHRPPSQLLGSLANILIKQAGILHIVNGQEIHSRLLSSNAVDLLVELDQNLLHDQVGRDIRGSLPTILHTEMSLR